MSTLERAFDALYRRQTKALDGVTILATVGTYAVNKPAILGNVDVDVDIVMGGTADAGGFELQMKVSDFSSEPPKGTAATCNGAATGKSLHVAGPVSNRGATYLIQLRDFAALGE